MGYTVTNVTVSESDEEAALTVSITMPAEADPIEVSFSLLVNTLDGTATGVPLSLEFDYVTHTLCHKSQLSPSKVKLCNIMLTHAHTNYFSSICRPW